MVAVDFTASNGEPNIPTSLHYRSPSAPNEYMQAIYATGAILEPYDADRMFPAFGFGGKLPDGKVYHDFSLNLNPNDVRASPSLPLSPVSLSYCFIPFFLQPRVLGVQGIIDA